MALETRNLHSSPGMDGIDFKIIQFLPHKYKLLLLDIYNELFLTGKYPDNWKNQYIHFINKPNGINVRPIALSPCLCKLFETMIKNRM